MKSKKFNIGVFASSISVAECVRRIAETQQYKISIAYEGLEEAIPVGEKMELSGIEVIISRRGTAWLLRENLRIPVLALPLTSLNLMMTLNRALAVGKKILLPSFRSPISHLEIIEEMLGIELVQEIYSDSSSLEQVVVMGIGTGCDVVIGGSVTMRFAKKYGIPYVEFVTAEEDIAATIESAKSVAQSNREEKESSQRYQSIINATSEGILAVDEKGVITTINHAAQRFLNIDHSGALGKPIINIFPDLDVSSTLEFQRPVYDKVEGFNGRLFLFNHLPVLLDQELIGAVATFKDVSNVMKAENKVRRTLSKGFAAKYVIGDLVHESQKMQDIVHMAKQFANTDSTILIVGETGTGKEVLAQSIHNLSLRKKAPFVSVNCAALPEQLLESELFGYEEGAFTGSKKGGKPGRFEIAHQGTLFMDEIDTTPENVQIRLLRILQEREVMRVGGDRKIPIDVRIIAAAINDLATTVQQDRFREDLFFRLNVLRIRIPPLRERREDIPVLLNHFIQIISKKHNTAGVELPRGYVKRLMAYDWPGNARQLRNFSERLVMSCNLGCGMEMLEELYEELIQYPLKKRTDAPSVGSLKLQEQLLRKKRENEAYIIEKALEAARFCKSKAAKNLGISRTTLWRKMKEVGLE